MPHISDAQPIYRLYQGLWIGLDWLFPPICGGCGKAGARWCLSCHQSQKLILPPICDLCGNPMDAEGVLCMTCRKHPPGYTAMRSWAAFSGPLRQAVHRLKYRGDIALGEKLSRALIEMVHSLDWKIDLVMPVPSDLARQTRRGYNQAAFLARPLALACNLPYHSRALVKTRSTPSQVGLTISERRVNVADAFYADPDLVRGRRVLVVDDVTTSGATLDACAVALRNAGALQVYCLTLARAVIS